MLKGAGYLRCCRFFKALMLPVIARGGVFYGARPKVFRSPVDGRRMRREICHPRSPIVHHRVKALGPDIRLRKETCRKGHCQQSKSQSFELHPFSLPFPESTASRCVPSSAMSLTGNLMCDIRVPNSTAPFLWRSTARGPCGIERLRARARCDRAERSSARALSEPLSCRPPRLLRPSS